MTSKQTFQIYVAPTDNSLKLCKFLDANITQINTFGVFVAIERVDGADDARAAELKKKGIVRLPAMVMPGHKPIIGYKNIREVFDENLSKLDDGGPAAAPKRTPVTDVSDYWERELFSGTAKDGKKIARTDPDEADDNGDALQASMAAYRKNTPKHRRSQTAERDIEPTRTATRAMRREEAADNIAQDDDATEPTTRAPVAMPQLEASGDTRGDDMDRMMMAAMLDNTM